MARTAASATEFELGLPSDRRDQLVEDPVGRDRERAERLDRGDPDFLGRLGILGERLEARAGIGRPASRPPAQSPADASRDRSERARSS